MSTHRNACDDRPIEYSFPKIPSIKLVDELVQVKLEILGLDFMVGSDKIPFGVAYSDMHPLQGFFRSPLVVLFTHMTVAKGATELYKDCYINMREHYINHRFPMFNPLPKITDAI